MIIIRTYIASNHTDSSVLCTDFRGKVLKFGLQNKHNWSIIGKILTEVLKCHGTDLGYWHTKLYNSPACVLVALGLYNSPPCVLTALGLYDSPDGAGAVRLASMCADGTGAVQLASMCG